MKIKHLQEHSATLKAIDPVTGTEMGSLTIVSPTSGLFRKNMAEFYKSGNFNLATASPTNDATKAVVTAATIRDWDDAFAASIDEPYSLKAAYDLLTAEGMDWLQLQVELFTTDVGNLFTRPPLSASPQESDGTSNS